MPIAEPPEWCRATIWPSWANTWVACGSAINTATGRCYQYGHPRKPEEKPVTNERDPRDTASPTMPPNHPGAQDQCATCGHSRWRHKEVEGRQVCTEYVDCACGGHFVEIPYATRLARVVEAAQHLGQGIAEVRDAMAKAMGSLADFATALRAAELLPDDEPQSPQAVGRHAADRVDLGYGDIENLRRRSVERIAGALDVPLEMLGDLNQVGHFSDHAPLFAHPAPLRQPSDWHSMACDKRCDGTCMNLGAAGEQRPYLHRHDCDQTCGDTCAGPHPLLAEITGVIQPPITVEEHSKPAPLADSCPTCYPRPCATNPPRSNCMRTIRYQHEHGTNCVRYGCPTPPVPPPNKVLANPAPEQATPDDQPHLCDGCGSTEHPVTATDDGRALACPDCLPAANAAITALQRDYCPDCAHPWSYHQTSGHCSMPVRPGTNTPASTPNDPTERCDCPTSLPSTDTPNP